MHEPISRAIQKREMEAVPSEGKDISGTLGQTLQQKFTTFIVTMNT